MRRLLCQWQAGIILYIISITLSKVQHKRGRWLVNGFGKNRATHCKAPLNTTCPMHLIRRGKLFGCALAVALFLVSVKITMDHLRGTDDSVLKSGERFDVHDLSDRVHSLYAAEVLQAASADLAHDNNESLGTPALHLIDIRNQSMNAPVAYSLAKVHPVTQDCNCVVDMNGRGPCCVRYYRRPHKMGNIQSLQLLPDGVRNLIRITSSEFLTKPPQYDYRDVVLVRDLYDAVISGYLYHLSGRECWLDMYGRPSNFTFRWIDNFWRRLDFDGVPPRNDRSLCQYLVDESTYDGLIIYTNMSRIWFQDLISSHRYSQTRADAKRTLFVCFGKLEHSQRAILEHFFPGGHSFAAAVPSASVDVYGGGHSTSRNESLRQELKELLLAIDERLYLGTLRLMNDELGCVGS